MTIPFPRLRRNLARRFAPPAALCPPLLVLGALLGLSLGLAPAASASIAYGSICNFDTVNDTGEVCHGFEIEIDDAHSTDITYTYDYDHYGVPKITQDLTDPLHPKVFVRYESAKNPDGTWASYTAIPSGPISPTDGHQFTNPAVNFGGEHFGVGFYGTPAAVKYSWLKDDGAGHLVFAGAVNISTPAFTYVPPGNGAAGQVQAAIEPPPPPEAPVVEFGPASWVKETRTTAHKADKVELKDLVSPDPNDPKAKDWRNGEPDEVEVEWQIMQTDFQAADGGAKGKVVGAAEDLPEAGDVVTRRWDFFQYVGPLDPETGEAAADNVGPDGIHGTGVYANVVVVGDYIGAQMAGFDPAGKIGLIDHVQDGALNVPYVDRSVVIGGTAPILTTRTGALPVGMTFNLATGVLSGTPTVSGVFSFTIHSTDAAGGDVSQAYTLNIVAPVTDATAQIKVARGGFRYSRATGRFVQTVTLTNTGGALTGPLSLVLDGLSATAFLANGTGLTTGPPTAGSPYLNAAPGGLAAGATLQVTLAFSDPLRAPISYTPRVLAGPGLR